MGDRMAEMTLGDRVNADPRLAALPIHRTGAHHVGEMTAVLATPAGVAADLAAVGVGAGGVVAGVAIGNAID